MSPKFVLTGDEKKVRFRNYFKKKSELERESDDANEEILDTGVQTRGKKFPYNPLTFSS